MSDDQSTIPVKRCSQCTQLFPATPDFFRKKHRRPGELHSWCKSCTNHATRKKYWSDPERMRKRSQQYRRQHPDKIRAAYTRWIQANAIDRQQSKARYYRANATHLRAYARRYYRRHRKEALQKAREWKKAHAKEIRLYTKSYQHPDPARRKLIRQAADERRRARKHNAPSNTFTAQQWHDMQARYKHCCAYCGKRRKGKLTQDHITPLSQGGGHTYTNIVPACRSCNSQKQTGPPPTPIQPFLLL